MYGYRYAILIRL